MTAETTRRDRLGFGLAFLVFLGVYLLFAGEVSTDEILAGVPTASVVACFAVALHRAEQRHLRLRAPWPRLLLRPLAALFVDAVAVGRVLLAALIRRPAAPIGIVSRQPFREGSHDPVDAARRGLVTLASSIAPNGYVLAIEPDSLVLHRLALVPPAPDPDWPL